MMGRVAVNVVLGALVLVVAGLILAGPARLGVRNLEYFPDMARSPRYNTFSPNPNFADGKTLQGPVPGTIAIEEAIWLARSRRVANTSRSETGAVAPVTTAPTDPAAVARGRVVFASFCEPCHGKTGTGDGAVTAHGYPPPPTLIDGGAATMSDQAIYTIVSRGSNDMPAYASQISADDRWNAIAFLRSLQKGGATPAQAATAGATR